MKRLLEAIVLFLISDIPTFAEKNDSIQSPIKSVDISSPSNRYRHVPPPFDFDKSHTVDEVLTDATHQLQQISQINNNNKNEQDYQHIHAHHGFCNDFHREITTCLII